MLRIFRVARRALHRIALVAVLASLVFSSLFPLGASASGKVIFLTSGTTWTVPSDWTATDNTIEVIGGGGGGGAGVSTANPSSGGGGGGYSKIVNASLTPGSSVTYAIGANGSGGASSGAAGGTGGDTYFNGASCGAASVCAKGGTGGNSTTAGMGGEQSGNTGGVGTTKTLGGNGGASHVATDGAGGGGGAAGAWGNGGNGASAVTSAVANGGNGGGGADNGNAGTQASSANGGAGGNGVSGGQQSGTGGSGGTSGSHPGGAGSSSNSSGGGGGGGGYDANYTSSTGGIGGAGTEWDNSHGSGGGGGGGGGGSGGGSSAAGGAAGNYGGGGGGGMAWGSTWAVGGAGGQGIIVITYRTHLTLTGGVKFLGNLSIVGALAKGSGTFVIDDPLAPRTKLLYHSFVESPDVKNIYNGIATLDQDGEVTIVLPAYWDALNKDPRYQFFPLYEAMPNLYIKEEEHDNRFAIAGGVPGGKVSWQITGIRHDAYILANPIIVEVLKTESTVVKKGQCLWPPLCR
jgi:hypothetical protein